LLLAGILCGINLLTRADALTFLPVIALAAMKKDLPRSHRIARAAGVGLIAVAVYSPWPARNTLRFHAPFFFGYYRTWDGRMQPPEPYDWARTWASGATDEIYFELPIINQGEFDLDRPSTLLPQMYSDEAERARVVA